MCAGAFEGPGGGYVCGLDGTFVGNVSCQDLLARVSRRSVASTGDRMLSRDSASWLRDRLRRATGPSTSLETWLRIRPGGACIVPLGLRTRRSFELRSCPSGFAPAPGRHAACGHVCCLSEATSIYFCLPFGSFLGFPPTCEALSCQALEMPLGAPPRLSLLVPGDEVQSNCQGLRYGQSCTAFGPNLSEAPSPEASCSYGFTGMETQFICSDGTLQGSLPSCASWT